MTEPLGANWPDSAWDISKSLKDELDAARTAAAWKAAAKRWHERAMQVERINHQLLQDQEVLHKARSLLVQYLCDCGNVEIFYGARAHGLYCKYRRKMEEEVSE